MLVEAVVAELPALCRGVVQVSDAVDAGVALGEEGGEVDQVLAVSPDLLDRMEHRLPVLRDRHETVVARLRVLDHCFSSTRT